MSMRYDRTLSALAEWTLQHKDAVWWEAQRRGVDSATLVIHMLDDILSVYRDQSDSEIEQDWADALHVTERT